VKDAFDALMWSSLMAALLAPLVGAGIYIYWVMERGLRVRETIVGFVVGLVLSGMVPGFLGIWIGALLVCALIDDRNCGFGGSLVGAPLGFAVGVATFIYVWTKRRTAP
jgi:hypothetical protein